MKLKLIIPAVVLAGAIVSQAQTVLWDLNADGNPINQATVDAFTGLGINEDLTGASVSQVIASSTNSMTDGTVSLSYITGNGNGVSDLGASPNAVVRDYIYGADAGPVEMQISGLSTLLTGNTTYALYLVGAGNADGQGTSFTFGGNTLNSTSIGVVADPSLAAVRFEFTTDPVAADTLNFTWDQLSPVNTYSALNGFAIAAVPEPSTFGLIGICSAALFLSRRAIRRQRA